MFLKIGPFDWSGGVGHGPLFQLAGSLRSQVTTPKDRDGGGAGEKGLVVWEDWRTGEGWTKT